MQRERQGVGRPVKVKSGHLGQGAGHVRAVCDARFRDWGLEEAGRGQEGGPPWTRALGGDRWGEGWMPNRQAPGATGLLGAKLGGPWWWVWPHGPWKGPGLAAKACGFRPSAPASGTGGQRGEAGTCLWGDAHCTI